MNGNIKIEINEHKDYHFFYFCLIKIYFQYINSFVLNEISQYKQ